MPWRFRDRFGPGGFRYLMENGTVYTNAHFQHSTTFTAVGHATLVSAGNIAEHGLTGNDWYNIATGKRVYCVEDDRYALIGKEPEEHEGTSPRNLTSSTFRDELILSNGGKSRVFSVSIKDRGAILPGGRLGKAFWYLSPNPDQYSAMHGSPYGYDTYVPIMFAGPGIKQQKIERPVAPRDIAPTVTAYLGIKPPSGAVGNPLSEVLQ